MDNNTMPARIEVSADEDGDIYGYPKGKILDPDDLGLTSYTRTDLVDALIEAWLEDSELLKVASKAMDKAVAAIREAGDE
jgi:hypothetical protein